MSIGLFSENVKIVNGLGPVDTGGVAKTADVVNTEAYQKICAIVTFGVITNACTITCTESTTAAGGGTDIGFSYKKITSGDTYGTRTAVANTGVSSGTTNNTYFIIEIDGGISDKNARQVYEAGVNMIVAGNSIFNTPDPNQSINNIKNA